MTKKKTVTIGISIFNEEATIGPLLDSMKIQTGDSFKLDQIIIILDGSTDGTKDLLSQRNDKNLKVIVEKTNKGKATRLRELYELNTSDIILILDGDVSITDQRFIEKLVNGFNNESIVIVSSNNQPIRPSTFIGKVWFANEQAWYETRKLAGNHLYNNSGCAVALEKEFAKTIIMPKEVIADQQFVFLSAMKLHKQFIFKKDAVVHYVPPSTLHDIKIQYARSLGEEETLHAYFDESFNSYFEIPNKYKLKGFLQSLIKDPFYTVASRIFLQLLPFLDIKKDTNNRKGLWQRTSSTKLTI